ncbi:CCA tRNA nucleotidyltransferase [Atopobiaceae bacterium 24-176]
MPEAVPRDAPDRLTPPAEGAAVIDALEAAGHSAWIVGGWVRDSLLGRPAHDVDVATSARWEDGARALCDAGIPVVETGTAHGTVTAVVGGVPVEVTTYRVDGAYTDGRHPDAVRFVDSVDDDLARRDFTVNAMAWHPARGLRDPFGGRRDLAAGLVRAVGDPDARMAEDALRVLRAVRFSARLGFAVEDATQAAVERHACGLSCVSRERIGAELRALLASGRGGEALRSQRTVLFAAVPELAPMDGFPQKTPYHSLDVLRHVARVMDYVEVYTGGVATERLRWAALLHDVGKPDCLTMDAEGRCHFFGHPAKSRDIARQVMARLAVPRSVAVPALALVRLHDRPVADNDRSVTGILCDLDRAAPGMAPALFFELMALKRADAAGKAPTYRDYAVEVDALEARGRFLLAAGMPLRPADLSISGADVMGLLGMGPGPAVGRVLRAALEAAQRGEVGPGREELLHWIDKNQSNSAVCGEL